MQEVTGRVQCRPPTTLTEGHSTLGRPESGHPSVRSDTCYQRRYYQALRHGRQSPDEVNLVSESKDEPIYVPRRQVAADLDPLNRTLRHVKQ